MTCREKHIQLMQVPTSKRDQAWHLKLYRIVESKRFLCKVGGHYFTAETFRDENNQPPCPYHKEK